MEFFDSPTLEIIGFIINSQTNMEKKGIISYHLGKAIMHCILSFSFFFTACTSNFLPIVKMEKNYPNYPTTSIAEIVEHVPDNAEYIGKIKLVPDDNYISFNKNKAFKRLSCRSPWIAHQAC